MPLLYSSAWMPFVQPNPDSLELIGGMQNFMDVKMGTYALHFLVWAEAKGAQKGQLGMRYAFAVCFAQFLSIVTRPSGATPKFLDSRYQFQKSMNDIISHVYGGYFNRNCILRIIWELIENYLRAIWELLEIFWELLSM